MAVYAAVSLTDSSASREEVVQEAEFWADWIGGKALQAERSAPPSAPLGQPWPPVD